MPPQRTQPPNRPARFRAPIDSRADPDSIARTLARLYERRPTDRVERVAPFAIRLCREPPWYLALTAACLFSLGLLGHIAGARITRGASGAHLLSALFELLAVGSIVRLWLTLKWQLEVRAAGATIVIEETFGTRRARTQRIASEEITAVLVSEPFEGIADVTLAGARHAEIARVYRTGFIDPPALPTWLASVLAEIVAAAQSHPGS